MSMIRMIRQVAADSAVGRSVHATSRSWWAGITVIVLLALPQRASALDFVWHGAGGNDDWDSIMNWSIPNFFPDDNGDRVTVNIAGPDPQLGANRTIGDLTVSNNGDVLLNTFRLTVQDTASTSGTVLVTGDGSTVSVGQGTLDTDALILQSSGLLLIGGGLAEVDVSANIGADAILGGTGRFQMGAGSSLPIVNNGTLTADSGTLQITRSATSTSTLDWDGTGSQGATLFVDNNSTLDIDLPLGDTAFNGTIILNGNSVLDTTGLSYSLDSGGAGQNVGILTKNRAGLGTVVANNFTLDQAPATINVNAGTLVLDATLGLGGSINIAANTTLQCDGIVVASRGNIINNGTVVFNRNADILTNVNFVTAGSNASLTVGPGATVKVDGPEFDLGNQTNTTINAGGILDINFNSVAADDLYQHTINLNGGTLSVTNAADALPWTLGLGGQVNANSGVSRISGDELNLFCGDLNVANNATLEFTTAGLNTTLFTNLNVGTGGLLVMADGINYSGGTFLGGGTLRNAGGSVVTASTAINVATFDWDGLDNLGTHTIHSGFVINSRLAEAGPDVMRDRIDLVGDGSSLTVNGPAEWIKRGAPINANTTQSGTARIAGTSRLILRSTLNVKGETFIVAPFLLESDGTINVDPGARVDLEWPSAPFVFISSGGTVNLSGVLEFSSQNAIVEAGAVIAGSGSLVNNRTLTLHDGVELGASLQNKDRLILGTSPGQVSGINFSQTFLGTLEIELAGTGGQAFDSMALSGSADLAGTLEVRLINGFNPALGHSFAILTAAGGIVNSFETEDFSAAPLGPGLQWRVNYNSNSVVLEVVRGARPYGDWIDSYPELTDPADKIKAANPDGDRLNNLGEFGLDGNPANPAFEGRIAHKLGTVGGINNVLTYTIPVRLGAVPGAGDPAGGELLLEQVDDELRYTIQAGNLVEVGGVATWPLDVTEITGADAISIQDGLPALDPGWEYRTFRSPGTVTEDFFEAMRVRVEALIP